MQPQHDGDRDQLAPHRSPTAILQSYTTRSGREVFYLVEPERIGPWDLEAVSDLRASVGTLGTGTGVRTPPPASAVEPKPLSKQTIRRLRLTQRALMLRAAGLSINEIGQKLGVASTTITSWFTAHAREVTNEEIDDKLDRVAVPLATENLIHGLLAGDKDYTLATLNGRGRFRKHSEGEGKAPTELPSLSINFQLPSTGLVHEDVKAGVVIGVPQAPKQITGSVIDAPPAIVLPSADAAPPDALAVGRPYSPDPAATAGVGGVGAPSGD